MFPITIYRLVTLLRYLMEFPMDVFECFEDVISKAMGDSNNGPFLIKSHVFIWLIY